ncbi:MAG TPA: glycosyltransferase [Thermoleophilaceae bacterium]|jgi:glycosyltransferase involved in cell wall biosynthesis
MRVCLVYDCLYPHTIGGAERWYRHLGERLAEDGHDVTYLTLRQWDRGVDPSFGGVRVTTAGPRMELYVEGRRRVLPPLVFGVGVAWHMLRHGRRYDAVHTASFPYFSLLAIGLAARLHRFRVLVDWHEVWSRAYWEDYLGRAGGRVGWAVQRLCTRVPQHAFCFSRLQERRLREEGFAGAVDVLTGEYAGSLEPSEPRPARPVVVFAGRHIPEKGVTTLVPALAALRERVPGVGLEIYGDGPQREEVLAQIAAAGDDPAVSAPGFVDQPVLEEAMSTALCLVLPSRREGYGLVVVEASARGVPVVVAAAPDNAATELVDDGENGFVAASAEPEDLADAIGRVNDAGPELRARTAEWFARNARRLSIESSLATVARRYRSA